MIMEWVYVFTVEPGGVEAGSVTAAASSSGSTVFEIQLVRVLLQVL